MANPSTILAAVNCQQAKRILLSGWLLVNPNLNLIHTSNGAHFITLALRRSRHFLLVNLGCGAPPVPTLYLVLCGALCANQKCCLLGSNTSSNNNNNLRIELRAALFCSASEFAAQSNEPNRFGCARSQIAKHNPAAWVSSAANCCTRANIVLSAASLSARFGSALGSPKPKPEPKPKPKPKPRAEPKANRGRVRLDQQQLPVGAASQAGGKRDASSPSSSRPNQPPVGSPARAPLNAPNTTRAARQPSEDDLRR